MSKFTAVTVKDWMALKGVEIQEIGNALVITGSNCVGKSSLLRALDCLVFGPKAAPDVPIRMGQDEAVLEADVVGGEHTYRIVRRVYRKRNRAKELTGEIGWTAKVMRVLEDGILAEIPSPQRTLEDLFGGRGGQVGEFATLGKTAAGQRRQIELLKEMAGIDTALLDAKIETARRQRNEAKAEVKRLDGVMASLDVPPADTPDEEVSVAKIAQGLEDAQALNADRAAKIANAEARVGRLTTDRDYRSSTAATKLREGTARVERSKAGLATAEADLEAAKVAVAEAKGGLRVATADLEELGTAGKQEIEAADAEIIEAEKALREAEVVPVEETDSLRTALANAEGVNTAVRLKRSRATTTRAIEAAQLSAAQLAAATQTLEAERDDVLATANLGVAGLAIDDERGCVTLGGVPIAQSSDSEALIIACIIYHAARPEAVLFIDGNGLDDESMGKVIDWGETEDVQIVIERLAAEHGLEIVATEDGSILADQQIEG